MYRQTYMTFGSDRQGVALVAEFVMNDRPGPNPPKLADFNNFSDSLPCAVFGLASAVSRDFHDVDRSFQ
uniref:hypothetical protein n=1 Tax=Massilia sp. TWR1-2-2 TaxID=2804584 RepID=UPI003CF482D1